MIRQITQADAKSIADIYNHYVTCTTATFEETPVSAQLMAERIAAGLKLDYPWLVYENEGQVCGYANAGVWKSRSAYRFTVEVTVYLAPSAHGQGIGTVLYKQLFDTLKARGVRTAIGVIALPNPASIALHEKFGMQKAAHFKDVGYKQDRWIDVGYWQLVFDDPI